ncbi:MAG: PulJ/GspJ family protein [Kiritimatiellia bacterium]
MTGLLSSGRGRFARGHDGNLSSRKLFGEPRNAKKKMVGGFSLIEMLAATALLGIVTSAAVSGFAYMLRADRLITNQNELDMDARILLDRLRHDLWQTSRERILLHPPDHPPYTAISFPVISGGADAINADGEIEWDTTVVYHFWTNDQFEVRRTEFASWVENDTTRQQQLADVSEDGNGASAANGDTSATRTLISNLVDWQINITTNTVDFGAASESIEEIYLGSARILTGTNTITFTSAGGDIGRYQLAADWFNLTPSGNRLEAEWMAIESSSGATPAAQNMGSNETWSGNSRLNFPANAAAQTFTLNFQNDSWEERNFNGTADSLERLERILVDDYTASTFGLELEGNGLIWQAEEQTRHVDSPAFISMLNETDVRVILRGDDLTNNFDGGWIRFTGTNVWATFEASSNKQAQIKNAYIAMSRLSADPGANPYEYISGTKRDFRFDGWDDDTGWFTGTKISEPLGYLIERTNTYIIGFEIEDTTNLSVRAWTNDEITSARDMYVYDGTSWVRTNAVYALKHVRAGHAPQGVYVSPVIDTGLSPDYSSIKWTRTIPTGFTSPSPTLRVQARAGASNDLSGVVWVDVMNDSTPLIDGRYFQVKAMLGVGVNAGNKETATPELHDIIMAWEGAERFAPITGKFQTGPSQGVYEVLVNDAPLMKGVTIDLTVYKDVAMGIGSPKRITASAFTEIIPRN